MNITWKHFAPIVVALVVAFIPAPEGLPQYAWYYFAIFAGVIVGLMFRTFARWRHRVDRRDSGREVIRICPILAGATREAGF